MAVAYASAVKGGVRLAVQIQPNARKTEVVGVLGDALKIKLAAQPIEGKANEALVKWLAATLEVPRGAVTLSHGLASKKKLLEVAGVTLEDVAARLAP